jgi:ABC-type uncharacterized transport system permease subunit|tara:strand:+ start:983 stop:1231 length:249 start_codon:yes stop_codon:yes gene_type:complete
MGMMLSVHQRISSLSMWAFAGLMAVMSSSAWAQAEDAVETLRPPKTSDAPSSPKFLMMGLVLVLLAAVVVVVTLKTKRDHQD